MARRNKLLSVLFLLEMLNASLVWAAEDTISKVADSSGGSCHLKVPAIKEETLFSDRPVLKDPSEGDFIDFYGPCNYDPLGKEAIRSQRAEYQYRMRKEYGRGD